MTITTLEKQGYIINNFILEVKSSIKRVLEIHNNLFNLTILFLKLVYVYKMIILYLIKVEEYNQTYMH